MRNRAKGDAGRERVAPRLARPPESRPGSQARRGLRQWFDGAPPAQQLEYELRLCGRRVAAHGKPPRRIEDRTWQMKEQFGFIAPSQGRARLSAWPLCPTMRRQRKAESARSANFSRCAPS